MEEYRQITLDEWTQWKEDIRRKLAETAENFVYIGYRLRQIRDSGMYDGAEDIFGFAQKEYGLGKSTVSRFIAINEKYSEGGNSLVLKEEFRNFSSSKLSEMLTLPDSEVELITEKTTIREIRELKAFNSQTAQETGEPEAKEAGDSAEAAGGEERSRTQLEKCIIDFFKDKRDIVNGIMRYLKEEPPAYKEAAELAAPSQTSHKKGIVFLFLYDWNTGVKYKLMTEPEPVSMSWEAFLNIVYGIFDKALLTESKRGLESVATSQQNGKREQDGRQDKMPEYGTKEVENQNIQEAAADDDMEDKENSAQGEACADSGQAGEPAADPESADKEDGTGGGAGENSAGSGADSEGGRGAVPVQPGDEQLDGQMNITDYPEYMPDVKPEKPEKTRTEAEGEEAAGVTDSGEKITDRDGMRQHIENQKRIIKDRLQAMGFRCDEGDWDGLIDTAKEIITRAESIKNMVEVWNV